MTGRLNGKVAIVTGAAQGIGEVYARGLAAHGATIALCDVRDPSATAASLRAAGHRVASAVVDVTDQASVEQFVQHVQAEFGKIDILVNNAALFGGLPKMPFTEIPAQDWDRVMAVNTRGVLHFTTAVVAGMKARRYGRIVNIASTTLYSGTPMLMHYVASKGAVLAMTRCMARELGDFGIAVNAIAPGLTMSEAVKQDYAGRDAGTGALAATVQRRCFKREQQPEDLLGPLLFLASDDSAFVTGQTYLVDGGAVLQ